ncbi:MAG: S-layer homology domain-containing protein, partial [Clostridia bacterium]|nr:S-layer homology domain-containing protein [Clostridia bacterium]
MKKFIAMLMTAAMLTASVFQTVSFAAFSDVSEDHQYKNAITTLSTLSVIAGYEDGTFKPDGAITRAEFTKLIVFMLGLQDIKYQAYTFADVSADHWARDYIQTGYDRKIIAGFDDGEFKAEEQVTYAQALKMIVCTLGYEDFALARVATTDGWADRYIQEANSLGLTKNVSGSDFYGSATRGMVAQMLYNALEINMNENNGFNWVSTEKTLLNDYLKVKKLKGTLVAVNDDVTGDCTVTLPENYIDILDSNGQEILIDYSTYTDQQTSLSKYLGNTITVYYRQLTSNDDRTLVSIDTETTKNSGIEITSDDVTGYVETGTLKYDDGSGVKVKTSKFKPDEITVRYNGKLVDAGTMVDIGDESYTRSEALSKWLTPDTDDSAYGTIKLTDNGDDGTYDMIQIYDYETIVALSAPSTTDYRITDKLGTGNSLILDPPSATYTFTIVKDNTEIPVTSIAANDVILYAQSLDGEQYSVIVSNKSVTGQISSMSSNGDTMTISGTSYNIGSKCAAYILDKNNKELKVGASGTFYLDAFGTAVYGTLQETVASPYAYITNTFREDDKYYITAYAPSTNASEASSYPLKSSVKINGVSTKAESAVSKIQAAAAYTTDESEYADKIYGAGKTPANTQYSQPARVKITNNEVTDIVLLTSDELVSQNEDKEKITKGKELDEYAYNNNSFTVG